MDPKDSAAHSYIVTVSYDTVYRAFLFLTLHDDIELVDTITVPGFVEKELFIESVRSKWYKKGTTELAVTNRKLFNLECIKDLFLGHKALVVDVGTQNSSVVSYKEGLFTLKEESFGTANGLLTTLASPSVRHTFTELVPFEYDKSAILDFLAEKELYPARYPSSMHERVLELLAARTIMGELALKHPRLFSLSSGSLTAKVSKKEQQTPTIGMAVLTGEAYIDHFSQEIPSISSGLSVFSFIDGTSVRGVWHLYQDGQGIIAALGRLRKEGVMINLLDKFIQQLGTVIVLDHAIPEGTELGVLRFDLGYQSLQEVHIKAGDIVRLPFDEGNIGSVTMELDPRVSIFGVTSDTERGLEVVGGTAGVIIDARRRTDSLSVATKVQVKHWIQELGVRNM